MPERYYDSHLRRIPAFQNLSDELLGLVGEAINLRQYNLHDFVFRQGEPTRGLHIFLSGEGLLYRNLPTGQREILGAIGAGQYINDAAMFQDGVQTANLEVRQPITALLLTRQNFANVLAHHPELREALGLAGSKDHHLHDVHFKKQRENEEVLLTTRRHWWAYIRFMWAPLLLAIPFWILVAAIPAIAPLIVPISLLVVVVTGAYLYFEWANDSVMITDQRVVRITHTILTFSEVRDEIAIESIQEANAEIPALDPFAWILKYGQVQLKTAGKEGNFTLDFMPNPEHVQKLIMDGHSKRAERKSAHERESMRAEVEKWINQPKQPPQPNPSPKNKKGVDEDKLEDIWKIGEGPISPFVTKFPTDEGGTVYRTHWTNWIRATIIPGLWILAGLAIMALTLIIPFLRDIAIISISASLVMLLFGGVWFYYSDWDWRHDYYVVTDTNIIIINQRPLWLKSENEQLLLKQVDNVAAQSSGIWQRIFKYGDVRVSLVGADQHKTFKNVANPLDVQEEITRRQARMKQIEAKANEQQQRAAIGEYLSIYHEQYVNQNQVDNAPRETTLRDASRPDIVPRQNPTKPGFSQGRVYQPDNPSAGYTYQPPQPTDYDVNPSIPPYQKGYEYNPQPQYPQLQNHQQPQYPQPQPYQHQPQNYPQAPGNNNPPLPPQPQYPPPNPPLPMGHEYSPPPMDSYNPPPPIDQNINPPLPPRERDSGRPPKFRRRND